MSVSVIAGNSRGDGPAGRPGDRRPVRPAGPVTGLALTPGDSSLAASWSPADSPGRPIDHYEYRVDGGGWRSAGPSTSTTIGSLANGTDYTVEVRACNGESGYPEDVRCGPASDRATGRPFGGLAAPTGRGRARPTVGQDDPSRLVVPGGNGRDVTAQTVKITGAANDDPDPRA